MPATSDHLVASERLARRWFSVVGEGAFDRLADLVHEDITLVSRVSAGAVVQGREDVTRFIRDTVSASLYEAIAQLYVPLDDAKIVVEGRMRWIDEERVIRDDPIVWALEFEDELLLRFVPARTTVEAETLLSAPR